MKTSDVFKAVVLFIISVIFVLIGCVSLAAQGTQLANMPTKETCNCHVVDAYQKTKNAIKTGKIIFYADGIMINFGASSKTLWKINETFYMDDKDKVWQVNHDKASGYSSLHNSKTIYVFKDEGRNNSMSMSK